MIFFVCILLIHVLDLSVFDQVTPGKFNPAGQNPAPESGAELLSRFIFNAPDLPGVDFEQCLDANAA